MALRGADEVYTQVHAIPIHNGVTPLLRLLCRCCGEPGKRARRGGCGARRRGSVAEVSRDPPRTAPLPEVVCSEVVGMFRGVWRRKQSKLAPLGGVIT